MQSNGGVTSIDDAKSSPVKITESGPAAGALAAAMLAREANLPNVVSLDMGGTTAKICMIKNGNPKESDEYVVGKQMTASARVFGTTGYIVSLPTIDMVEIGAGGGSVVWVDEGGLLRVGPASAGAVPGPACYGLGGVTPTFTDACVVLGYLSPEVIAGGTLQIHPDKAVEAFDRAIGKSLRMTALEAAHGAYTIAISNMMRGIRAVSFEVGQDPSDCILVAFGGAGPMVAAEIARSLRMKQVIIPPAAGVFSAVGLLVSDSRHDYIQAYLQSVDEVDVKALYEVYCRMELNARRQLEKEGYKPETIVIEKLCDVCYKRQGSTICVPINFEQDDVIARLIQDFTAQHEQMYKYITHEPIEIVNLRIQGIGLLEKVNLSALRLPSQVGVPSIRRRRSYFGPDYGFLDVDVSYRHELAGRPRRGPLVIEEADATVVIPPECSATLDNSGNIVITIGRPIGELALEQNPFP